VSRALFEMSLPVSIEEYGRVLHSTHEKCRIGFPRQSKTELELNDVINCLAVNSKKQPRKRLQQWIAHSAQNKMAVNLLSPANICSALMTMKDKVGEQVVQNISH